MSQPDTHRPSQPDPRRHDWLQIALAITAVMTAIANAVAAAIHLL